MQTPQNVRDVEPSADEDHDLDLALREMQQLVPGGTVLTPRSPPSDAGKDLTSRVTYLRTICTNYHFRIIVDWLSKKEAQYYIVLNL